MGFGTDARYLVDRVLDVHFNPAIRIGEDALQESIDRFLTRAEKISNPGNFKNEARKFLLSLGDAETFVIDDEKRGYRAPVSCVYLGGSLLIDDFMPGTKDLKPGDTVLFLNGKEIHRQLLSRLEDIPFNVVDYGLREAAERLFEFAEKKEEIELTVAGEDGKIKTVKVPLYSKDSSELQNWLLQRQKKKNFPPVEGRIIEELQAGYLRYRRCFDRNSPMFREKVESHGINSEEIPLFEEVCRNLFTEMQRRNLDKLIIDLRGNSGGDSVIARSLFKFITKKPLKDHQVSVKVSVSAKEFMKKNRNLYGPHWQEMIDKFLETPPGEFQLPRPILEYPYDDTPEKNLPQVFNGEILVFIDAGTFSAGENLAVILKDNGIGTFVGEPTGMGGTAPGDTLTFKTPKTGLVFNISYKIFCRPDEKAEKNPGVVPDFFQPPKYTDFIEGKDTLLKWAANFWGKNP